MAHRSAEREQAGSRLNVILSTHNRHKVTEVSRILAPLGMTVEPLPDWVRLPPEDGDSFAENAFGKARAAAAQTGRVSIADDSGIEAEALGGAPGIRSARYAGPQASDAENLEKFIAEVAPGTGLRYVCALAWVDPAGSEERVFHGDCHGRMAAAPRGRGGFGYDPIFLPADLGGQRTMAELSEAEKDAISHRGRALRALAAWLRS